MVLKPFIKPKSDPFNLELPNFVWENRMKDKEVDSFEKEKDKQTEKLSDIKNGKKIEWNAYIFYPRKLNKNKIKSMFEINQISNQKHYKKISWKK